MANTLELPDHLSDVNELLAHIEGMGAAAFDYEHLLLCVPCTVEQVTNTMGSGHGFRSDFGWVATHLTASYDAGEVSGDRCADCGVDLAEAAELDGDEHAERALQNFNALRDPFVAQVDAADSLDLESFKQEADEELERAASAAEAADPGRVGECIDDLRQVIDEAVRTARRQVEDVLTEIEPQMPADDGSDEATETWATFNAVYRDVASADTVADVDALMSRARSLRESL